MFLAWSPGLNQNGSWAGPCFPNSILQCVDFDFPEVKRGRIASKNVLQESVSNR